MFAELYLTDGDRKLNLLGVNSAGKVGGYSLRQMTLSRPQRSPSGIFRQTYGAVNETYDISISGFSSDEVAGYQQALDRWLEQAQNFFEGSVEQDLIWLVARTLKESKYRYAVIYGGVLESYGNVYGQPYMGTMLYTLNELTLGLERSTWLGNPPYSPECVPVHNVISWNSNAPTITNVRTVASVQSMYLTASNYVLAGGHQIQRSIDQGGSWANELVTGVNNLRFWKFQRDSSSRIWAVAGMSTSTVVVQCGIYYSDDQGDNWTQHTNTVDFYNVVYRSRDNTLFFGGDGEVRYIQNGGALTVLSTLPTGKCKAMAIDPDGNIVVGDDYNVWRIPGAELTLYAAGIDTIYSTDVTTSFLVAVYVDDYFLMGNASNIMISRNQGKMWSIFWRDWGIDAMYALDNGAMLASRSGNTGIYVSNDSGLSWNTYFTASAQPTRAFLELGDTYLFLGSLDSVYRRVATDADYYYGPIVYSCDTLAYIANHRLQSQWTHIMVFDSSAGTYTTYTPADMNFLVDNQTDALALPSPVGGSDAMYIGISTSVVDAGPFSSLYIELTDVNYTLTVVVEYYNGSAWTAYADGSTMSDGTQGLRRSGAIVLCLPYNAAMTPVAINGVTAWWVRLRVTALGGLSSQLPKFRNVYLINQPYIEFDNIRGDVAAIARMIVNNESYMQSSSVVSATTEMIVGLRSMERGEDFTSIINFARIQNPLGINIYNSYASVTWVSDATIAAAGEFSRLNTAGSDTSDFQIAAVQFDSEMSNQYAGTYQVYLRCARSGGSALDNWCKIRLSVQSFSSISIVDPGIKTEYVNVPISPPYSGFYPQVYSQNLYMGQITFKPDRYLAKEDSGYRSQIIVEAFCRPSVSNYVVSVFDIILIPADEWVGHFYASSWAESAVYREEFLDIDSAKFPKRVLRSFLRKRGTERINSAWTANASGAFVLSPGDRQRLWFFTPSNHSMVHSAKLWHNQRWLGLRGND